MPVEKKAYRSHGGLPETPDFLEESAYCSSLPGETFDYVAGALTDEDGKPFRGFRLSVVAPRVPGYEPEDAGKTYSFSVSYPD